MSSAAAMGAAADDEPLIDVVMIQVGGASLLVPNVCVAEILPWRRPLGRDEVPAWYCGELEWRDRRIALVDWARLSDDGVAQAEPGGACQVVINRIRPDTAVSFYALAATALPRLLHVAAEDLERTGDGQAFELMDVRVGTESARIPDLGAVEALVARYAPA